MPFFHSKSAGPVLKTYSTIKRMAHTSQPTQGFLGPSGAADASSRSGGVSLMQASLAA